MMNIPNLLTLSRIVLVPFLIVLLSNQHFFYSFLVYTIAGFTDALDGFIARYFNARSRLGAILDPIADKCLMVAMFVTLSTLYTVPFWLMVIVVLRDVFIVIGYCLLLISTKKIDLKPLWLSKLNTIVQFLYILLVLVSLTWSLEINSILVTMSLLVLLTTLTSGVAYLIAIYYIARRYKAQRV